MKSKIATALLACAILAQSLASCGDISSVDTDATSDTETFQIVTAADIGRAIEEEFGKNYGADTDIDSEILDAIYGIKPEWVKEAYAKNAAMGYNGDLFIAVLAADKHAGDVEDALKDFADYNVNYAVQYPANQPKINAGRVYRVGDYVFYIILGVMDYDLDADANYKTADSYNSRAVGVIDSLLGK